MFHRRFSAPPGPVEAARPQPTAAALASVSQTFVVCLCYLTGQRSTPCDECLTRRDAFQSFPLMSCVAVIPALLWPARLRPGDWVYTSSMFVAICKRVRRNSLRTCRPSHRGSKLRPSPLARGAVAPLGATQRTGSLYLRFKRLL